MATEHLALWSRFERCLESHAPRMLADFSPPATAREIDNTETILGVELPEDVRTAYLRHNGSRCSQEFGCPLLFTSLCQWATLEQIIWGREYRRDGVRDAIREAIERGKDPQEVQPAWMPEWQDFEVCPVWYDDSWIPIGISNTPTMVHVDLHPGGLGRRGQLLYDHGTGEPVVIAGSFNEHLERLIVLLESGKIVLRAACWFDVEDNEPVWDWTRYG